MADDLIPKRSDRLAIGLRDGGELHAPPARYLYQSNRVHVPLQTAGMYRRQEIQHHQTLRPENPGWKPQ
jgi:hypothetical protein